VFWWKYQAQKISKVFVSVAEVAEYSSLLMLVEHVVGLAGIQEHLRADEMQFSQLLAHLSCYPHFLL
jgi:hypothetical protein